MDKLAEDRKYFWSVNQNILTDSDTVCMQYMTHAFLSTARVSDFLFLLTTPY